MKILVFFLLLIILFLVSLLYFQRKDINKITKELEYINSKNLMNKQVNKYSNREHINNLIGEINNVLNIKQKVQIQYEQKEEENKEIIASISHDLRTPLTSIKGYTDLLYENIKEEENKKYLNIIKSRIESLSELITTFYELSKLELKEVDYDFEYVDIKDVLMNTMVSYYENFKDKEVEPVINIDSGNFEVLGDMEGIKRVFINLIDNSLKYGDKYFEVNLKIVDGRPIIEFINDVENIDEESVKKLFEKFYIIDTSRQSESTGLGLYITKKILNNMGYKIYAQLIDENIKISIDWK